MKKRFIKKSIIVLMVFLIAMVSFVIGTNTLSNKSVETQKETLEVTLNRGIIQCYAIEGSYPESLDYLKEHYHISYNENLFYVDYHTLGANLAPDVTVIIR